MYRFKLICHFKKSLCLFHMSIKLPYILLSIFLTRELSLRFIGPRINLYISLLYISPLPLLEWSPHQSHSQILLTHWLTFWNMTQADRCFTSHPGIVYHWQKLLTYRNQQLEYAITLTFKHRFYRKELHGFISDGGTIYF